MTPSVRPAHLQSPKKTESNPRTTRCMTALALRHEGPKEGRGPVQHTLCNFRRGGWRHTWIDENLGTCNSARVGERVTKKRKQR